MVASDSDAGSVGGEQDKDLRHRSVSGVIWGSLGSVLRMGLQVVAQIVLARILGPEQYGLFAAAMIVLALSAFFADIGLSYGLIQKSELRPEDVRFVVTWQGLLGALIAFGLFAGSDLIASFFNDGRVAGVMRWMALAALLSSMTAPSACLLKRDLDFKWLNIAGVIGYAVGFLAVGVPMALGGWQVQSLVAAYLVSVAITLVLLYARTRHTLRPLLWYAGAADMIRFGGTVFATNIVNWVMSSIDRAVIGRMFPISAVGLYSTINNFILTPAQSLLTTLQGVLYSAGLKVDQDRERLATAFTTMVAVVALAVAPMFFAVAAVADTVVLGLYGERWRDGAAVLVPLALAMPVYFVWGVATPILWASGNVTTEFRQQVPIALVWTVGCLVTALAGSLPVMAWAVAALYLLRSMVLVRATLKLVDLRARRLLADCRAGIMVSIGVAAIVYAGDLVLRRLVDRPAIWLVGDMIVGAFALLLALRLVRSVIPPDVIDLGRRLLSRLPGPVGTALERWMGMAA